MGRIIEVMIITRDDLVPLAQTLPIDQIQYHHVKDRPFWLAADRVEFHDNGKVRVLRNRLGLEN